MLLRIKVLRCPQLRCLPTWRRGKVKRSSKKVVISAAVQGTSLAVSVSWCENPANKKHGTHRLRFSHFLYFPQVIVINPEMCRPQQSTVWMKTLTLRVLRKVWLLAVSRARSQLTVSQTQIPQKTPWSPLCHHNLSYSKTRSSSIHRGSPYQRNTRLCTSLRTGHCPLISHVWVEIDFQNKYVLQQNGDSNMALTEHGIHSLIKCWKGLQEVMIFDFVVYLGRRVWFIWKDGSWEGIVMACLLMESTGKRLLNFKLKCQHLKKKL